MSPPEMPASLLQTRTELRALAEELVQLTETYEPRGPSTAWGVSDPLVIRAKEFLLRAQTPMDHATSMSIATMETASVRTLLQLNALQSIPPQGSISLKELASKTGAEAGLLERLLRTVTSGGFLRRGEDGGYAHTHLSVGFTAHNCISTRFAKIYDEGLSRLIRLPEYLEHQRKATGILEEPGASRDSTLFNLGTWASGFEGQKNTCEVMEMNPARIQHFQSTQGISGSLSPYTGIYDFSKLKTNMPNRMAFVDVGGEHGHAIMGLLKAHPEIRPEQCVLEDTVDIVSYAQKHNSELPAGVQFQAHDFFQPQPIKGARAYHLRSVLHGLSDANSVRVLRQILPQMAPDSKILIAESMIPGEAEDRSMTAMQDMLMMVFGGKERTEAGFRKVLDEAGLRVDEVWRAEGGEGNFAVIEASLKHSWDPVHGLVEVMEPIFM